MPDLLIASLGYQSWLIYPYTFLHRVQVPRRKHRNQPNDDNTIRLLIANVFMENTHIPELQSLVKKHKPDVLLVLEGNEKWRKALTEIDSIRKYLRNVALLTVSDAQNKCALPH